MKRIIDGVTYNTDTATLIARSEWVETYFNGNPPDERHDRRLYQTRGGAFFVHTQTETERQNFHGDWEPVTRNEFDPLTREEAHNWIMEGNVELLNDVFGEPPEAAEEAAPGATLYIRVPSSLKDRIETLAKNDGVSLNAWTMRCVERCGSLDKVGEYLGEIMQTALSSNAGADDAGMIQHMRQQAEAIAELLGWREEQIEDLCTRACQEASIGSDIHVRWPMPDEEEEDERRARISALLDAQKAEDERRYRWRRKLEEAFRNRSWPKA